jgi:hypothetical protein
VKEFTLLRILLNLSLALIILVLIFEKVTSASPSFPRQEIVDKASDLIDERQQRPAIGHSYTDIIAANFVSNGRLLNATLWLLIPFQQNTSNIVSYGMYIDADSNNKTGVGGVDYYIEISGQNGKWNRTSYECIAMNVNKCRSISQTTDLKGFHGNIFDRYVSLFADLDSMGSPNQYKVFLYAEEKSRKSSTIDFTDAVNIPPAQFIISTVPSSVILRPGDKETIEVQVKSTTGFTPKVDLYTSQSGHIQLHFVTNKLFIPPYGIASVPLDITIPQNIPDRPYTLILSGDATFPFQSFIPINSSEDTGISFPFIQTNKVTSQTALIVTILKPLSFQEQVSKFFNDWFAPFTGIYQTTSAIIGGIVGWIIAHIKNKQNKTTNRRIDDFTSK